MQSYRPYIDLFGETWKAFSRHPVKRLSDFEGKRVSQLIKSITNKGTLSSLLLPPSFLLSPLPPPLPPSVPLLLLLSLSLSQMCFSDALFPLLARMRHGLYYNTYLLPGCYGSGLMQAFSKHLLARLGIYQEDSDPQRVRVTLLSRSTKHRRIVNEEEVGCV